MSVPEKKADPNQLAQDRLWGVVMFEGGGRIDLKGWTTSGMRKHLALVVDGHRSKYLEVHDLNWADYASAALRSEAGRADKQDGDLLRLTEAKVTEGVRGLVEDDCRGCLITSERLPRFEK